MNRQKAARYRDDGYSLVEMMIAMAIALVVLGLVTGSLLGAMKSSAGTRTKLANLSEVRDAVDAMSRTLRTGVRPEQFERHLREQLLGGIRLGRRQRRGLLRQSRRHRSGRQGGTVTDDLPDRGRSG